MTEAELAGRQGPASAPSTERYPCGCYVEIVAILGAHQAACSGPSCTCPVSETVRPHDPDCPVPSWPASPDPDARALWHRLLTVEAAREAVVAAAQRWLEAREAGELGADDPLRDAVALLRRAQAPPARLLGDVTGCGSAP